MNDRFGILKFPHEAGIAAGVSGNIGGLEAPTHD
jgi:hypothetical protein